MHEYLMGIYDMRFAGMGKNRMKHYAHFTIEAENKADAIAKASIYVRQTNDYHSWYYDKNDVVCIKKLQK